MADRVTDLKAPFPYFGGKSFVAAEVWARFGEVKQYNEPFCGSAAILLKAPKPASLEVVNDLNGFIANFWRAVKNQPSEVIKHADYPVSHIDLSGRHEWLMNQRETLGAALLDPNWIGDAKIAGWWVWGQCCWIGSGWCDWSASGEIKKASVSSQIPHISDAGMGIQKISVSSQIPHIGNAGMGIQNTQNNATEWIFRLARRLDRVRVLHGHWGRCLNTHRGEEGNGIAAIFFDPPYKAFETLYGTAKTTADEVAEWCRARPHLRIALCGHLGDYDLPDWDVYQWERRGATYRSTKTRDKEAIWFSPACIPPRLPSRQLSLMGVE